MQSNQGGHHVAIIMDGNGRWAVQRGLPRAAGRRAGIVAVRRVVEPALDLGIARLTLYAFSTNNWRRPDAEVQSIFWLLRVYLRLEAERLRKRGARLQGIGRRDRLQKEVVNKIKRAEALTAAGCNLHLYVAIDYSSRDAITRAALQATASLSPRDVPSPPSLVRY
jgi:undecaprenyl diphosphate synthase